MSDAALLTRFGVPGRFAPGRWGVNISTDGIELTFVENAAAYLPHADIEH